MLIHITGSESGFRYDLGQQDAKAIALCTPRISGDQKQFERVYYMFKIKSHKVSAS